MIGSIRSALSQIGGRRFDVCPLAMCHAPVPEREYAEVLVDSGRQGRMFRALVNLIGVPIEQLRITNVSGFGIEERNMFAAFADAQEYRVVQRIVESEPRFIGHGIGDSQFAISRRGRIQNTNAYYYLAPYHGTDVALAPHACSCCFDMAYLDYMKSCFELTRLGAMLIVRFGPNFIYDVFDSPLAGWMSRAGFEETWFFGADNIKSWKKQAEAGQGFSLEGKSHLIVLDENKVKAETNALSWDYGPGVPRDNYLVFQRIDFPSVSTMRALFLEIIDWEDRNMGHRLGGRAERFVGAQKYLAKFKEMLPVFLASYQSAGEQILSPRTFNNPEKVQG